MITREELRTNDLRIVEALMSGNHLEQYELLRAQQILKSLAINLHIRNFKKVE